MRTTIDLPDRLFKEAKSAAAQRGMTLRDVIEEALRRQLQTDARPVPVAAGAGLEVKNGMLVIKRKGRSVINPTAEQLDDWSRSGGRGPHLTSRRRSSGPIITSRPSPMAMTCDW